MKREVEIAVKSFWIVTGGHEIVTDQIPVLNKWLKDNQIGIDNIININEALLPNGDKKIVVWYKKWVAVN